MASHDKSKTVSRRRNITEFLALRRNTPLVVEAKPAGKFSRRDDLRRAGSGLVLVAYLLANCFRKQPIGFVPLQKNGNNSVGSFFSML